MLLIHQPADQGDDLPRRVVLSRFGQWWASLARYADGTVLLRPMGAAMTRDAAAGLVCREVEGVCGVNDAARFEPMTVATERLLALATQPGGLERMLIEDGATVDQLRAGLALADAGHSAQCSIVALQSGQKVPVVTDHVVTVGDTACGRMMVKNVRGVGGSGPCWLPAPATSLIAQLLNYCRRCPRATIGLVFVILSDKLFEALSADNRLVSGDCSDMNPHNVTGQYNDPRQQPHNPPETSSPRNYGDPEGRHHSSESSAAIRTSDLVKP